MENLRRNGRSFACFGFIHEKFHVPTHHPQPTSRLNHPSVCNLDRRSDGTATVGCSPDPMHQVRPPSFQGTLTISTTGVKENGGIKLRRNRGILATCLACEKGRTSKLMRNVRMEDLKVMLSLGHAIPMPSRYFSRNAFTHVWPKAVEG